MQQEICIFRWMKEKEFLQQLVFTAWSFQDFYEAPTQFLSHSGKMMSIIKASSGKIEDPPGNTENPEILMQTFRTRINSVLNSDAKFYTSLRLT